jgi:hypothetical protein
MVRKTMWKKRRKKTVHERREVTPERQVHGIVLL